MARRIDRSEIATIRARILKQQGGKCAICKQPIDPKSRTDYAVLDHDHKTGYIRAVLHNNCNKAEGKVKTKAQMCHKGIDAYEYLISLGEYLKLHKEPQTNLLHPEHLTEAEKAEKRREYQRKYRAKQKRLKAKQNK